MLHYQIIQNRTWKAVQQTSQNNL